jgi:hypothetical protein
VNYRRIFLSEMIGLSIVLTFLPIPFLSLAIVPLVMVVSGFYYSYFFALGSLYFDTFLKPTDPGPTFLFGVLFRLSSATAIPVWLIFTLCFAAILPGLVFVGIIAAYKPIRHITQTILKNRIKIGG